MTEAEAIELLADGHPDRSGVCRLRYRGSPLTGLGLPLDGYRTTPPLLTVVELTVAFVTTLPGVGEYTEHLWFCGDGRIVPVVAPVDGDEVVGFDADYRDLLDALHGGLLLSTRLHSGLVETAGDIAALSFAEGIVSGRPFQEPPSDPELLAALRRFADGG